MTTLIRARLLHTPGNPFLSDGALEHSDDGALVFANDKILASGDYPALRQRYPEAAVQDERNSYLIPGMVDTHVHYPQIPIIGAVGLRLLDWLEQRTLPEEAKLADASYARKQARIFLDKLLRNGTTSALVFGAHFATAMDVFFEEAQTSGLRITAGLVLGDRLLHDKLHTTAEAAYSQSTALATKWHAKERLRYAVTPRFSLSCSEAILEVCGTLLEENPDLFFTSHLNEQSEEIAAVSKLFPWTQDYLETYDRYGLVTRRSVFAHNVHPQERELERLAQTGSSICHCPSSNMFIGSGLFPLQKHLKHGVHVALGSDVGGGTGFSLLKEGLMAYQGQMLLAKDGYPLTAAHLLYLATAAGARALALENEVGDLQAGKQADFVLLRPQAGSTLEAVLAHSPSAEASLAALFTLAQEDAVAKVYVAGKCNFARA